MPAQLEWQDEKHRVIFIFDEGAPTSYHVSVSFDQLLKLPNEKAVTHFVSSSLYANVPELAMKKPSSDYLKNVPPYLKNPPLWSNPGADILGDIQKFEQAIKEQHYNPTGLQGASADLIAFDETPDFQLMEEKTLEVTIGPDLTEFKQNMEEVGSTLAEAAKSLGAEFQQLSEAFATFTEAMKAIVGDTAGKIAGMPATSVTEHPGLKKKVDCPVKSCGMGYKNKAHNLKETIIHLNDHHKWKRERVANWLDTLDEQPIFYPKVDDNVELQGA